MSCQVSQDSLSHLNILKNNNRRSQNKSLCLAQFSISSFGSLSVCLYGSMGQGEGDSGGERLLSLPRAQECFFWALAQLDYITIKCKSN